MSRWLLDLFLIFNVFTSGFSFNIFVFFLFTTLRFLILVRSTLHFSFLLFLHLNFLIVLHFDFTCG
ncbi:hypothetical protein HanXRQr2_Chr06g0255141 [Helianthus annuus]|uniref:Uncharacterized protein n=1 Tax=Helianthus annuus TaxID=4232 RepID=A0A9K3ISL8_HELAN|nr:hypothetical protein HanXRQr2_Chr06g0255141 [Helianthus annuus]KAJ0915116.1 hypothetical protein HanPSC8_Chr06g0246241 [Helianthus annuus]